MIDQLCKERDKLRRTEDRLRLERTTAHEECNQTVRERDEARREAKAR